MSFEELVTK